MYISTRLFALIGIAAILAAFLWLNWILHGLPSLAILAIYWVYNQIKPNGKELAKRDEDSLLRY